MFEITPSAYAVGGAVARLWQHRPARRDIASLEEFARFAEPRAWLDQIPHRLSPPTL
jgi:hypothetical protein